MKYLNLLLTAFLIYSCNSDSENLPAVYYETVTNLHAPLEGGEGRDKSRPITKFDVESGLVTENEWDIAFRGTSIIVNGGSSLNITSEPETNGNAGAYIHNGLFTELESVDNDLFLQDSEEGYAIQTGSGNGWYTYTSAPNYLINPIPGRVLVFRTRDNKYAKVEIISYYFDAPENPDSAINESRYYTFNYVYQSELGNTSFN